MSILTAAYHLFRPDNSPGFMPLRLMSTGLGLMGLISAVVGKVFAGMCAAEAYFLGGISATVFVGGAIGSFGMIVLPIIIGLGVSMALTPAPVVYGVIVV